jgi:hypothetical protein
LTDDDQFAGRQPDAAGRPVGPGRRPSYPVVASGLRTSYGFRSPGRGTGGRRRAAVPAALLDDRGHRRFSEFIMPASVILAGVLIVVAFGVIVSRAVRSDNSQDNENTPPAAQLPVLGAAPLGPPDQSAIPLPSPSDTPSPAKTTDSAAPQRRQTTPTDVGTVSMTKGTVPGLVNLSAEGKRDWVHWGEKSTFSLERDKQGDFAILEGAPIAPRIQDTLSPHRFSWTGGSPVADSDGTTTGIHTCGAGNGFTISAPAATSTRTLRLYVGVLAARGQLDARLSTGGKTVSSQLETQSTSLDTAVFTMTYRAPKNGTIQLTWITEASFNKDCGGVALEAATLH